MTRLWLPFAIYIKFTIHFCYRITDDKNHFIADFHKAHNILRPSEISTVWMTSLQDLIHP